MSPIELKKREITSWIRMFRRTPCNVMISNYCYNCLLSGDPRTKTLIVFPDEMDTNRIMAIDKPLTEVEIPDVIELCQRIK